MKKLSKKSEKKTTGGAIKSEFKSGTKSSGKIASGVSKYPTLNATTGKIGTITKKPASKVKVGTLQKSPTKKK